MKIVFRFSEFSLLLFTILIFTGDLSMSQIKNQNTNKVENVVITVLYDNYQMKKGLETDWGFSCLIEVGKIKLLFDTGESGEILLRNMSKLEINPENIDFVFLSHFHHDHTGGLSAFLKKNSNVTIYFPQSFPDQLINEMKKSGAKLFPVSSFQELQTNIFSLGELDGNIPEQSLAIRSPKGIIIITGCAHPGIINILQKANEFFPNETIYLALGGFHLIRKTENELMDIINKMLKMEILNVAPSHCSGNKARNLFKDAYQNNYIQTGAGKIIEIK
ncbi:MAG: MBL fold metallo-hydrolase [Ignavibacteriaceae bacterium]